MNLTRVARKPLRGAQKLIRTSTVRDFSGGWDVIDSELSLSSKYCVVSDNVSLHDDGSVSVRYGTGLLADIAQLYGLTPITITGAFYFQGFIVVTLDNGEIVSVAADGSMDVIWSAAIAAALPGTVPTWSGGAGFASFAVFNNELLVFDGLNKPLRIDFGNATPVNYLVDIPTSSNANVPVARYVCVVGQYVVAAGDPVNKDRLYISNKGTSGTWYGDSDPNDGIYVDLGKYASVSSQDIRGIAQIRGSLVVAFDNTVIIGKLGIYTTDDTPVHTPDFSDVMEGVGCSSHHAMQSIGNDLLLAAQTGITSVQRAQFTGGLEPQQFSELISPRITRLMSRLSLGALATQVFSVYNPLLDQYMLFVPNHEDGTTHELQEDAIIIRGDDPFTGYLRIYFPNHPYEEGDQFTISGATAFNTLTTEMLNTTHTVVGVVNSDYFDILLDPVPAINNTVVVGGGDSIVLTDKRTETHCFVLTSVKLKSRTWARYRGWDFVAACVTEQGRVVFADRLGKLFVLGNQNEPYTVDFYNPDDDDAVPTPIKWEWEWPWTDFKERETQKYSTYVRVDSSGTSPFTLQMFVDDLLRDGNGQLTPALSTEFVGGSIGGYGAGPQPYGGGRRTSDVRLYGWPCRFKTAKMRFSGQSTERLRIVALTILYQLGNITPG